MKAVEGRVVRPTLRCLIDDLGNEVGPASLRATLSTARRDVAGNSRFLCPVPLSAAEHLLTDKANLLALDPNADRELIVSITDRSVVKVKSSDRRGALWADADGMWWLLAAGRRKDDGSGDFYREVAKFGSDSSPIAPTADDLNYLQLETAYIADCALDRDAHTAIVEAILAAAASPGQPQSADVFGARVAVQIDAGPGDEMLSVAFDFLSFDQRARFPVDVLAISYLATAVELDGLLNERTVPAASALNQPTAGRIAHRAAAALVTLSYVEGIEITALCGVRFVAHRDPEFYDECPTCGAALALLRQTLSPES